MDPGKHGVVKEDIAAVMNLMLYQVGIAFEDRVERRKRQICGTNSRGLNVGVSENQEVVTLLAEKVSIECAGISTSNMERMARGNGRYSLAEK